MAVGGEQAKGTVLVGEGSDGQREELDAHEPDVPAVIIPESGVDPRVLGLVPVPLAHHYRLVPVRRVGRFLTVAMTDPTDRTAINAVEAVTGLEVLPAVANPAAIRRALSRGELAVAQLGES